MTIQPPIPKIPGCRNPHEGENPLKTILRLIKKEKNQKKTRTVQEILKDKIVY